MAQPILYSINAWDATIVNTLSFSYSGNQVFKNQAIIRDNITNTVVYDQTQTTFQLKHTIAENSLQNGVCYNIELRVFDKDDIASVYSKKEIFYCYSTPVFEFSNVIPNQIIKNSSYEVQIIYSQTENEPLNNYQFTLYNDKQLEIIRSGMFYNTSLIKYTISHLDDKSQYYIQATGQTLNNMIVDTGLIPISVRYTVPSLYALVDLQNLYKQGLIKIRSNIISITGKPNPDPVVYINDEEVDLTLSDSWIKFDEGFELNGDFTLQLKARSLIKSGLPLILSNGTQKIEVKYMTGNFAEQVGEKGFFILKAFNSMTNYVTISNYIDLPIVDTDKLHLWVRRINNVYEISVTNLGGVV